MASLSNSNGKYTCQFIDLDGRRKSVRLGGVDKRTAHATKLRIEALLSAKVQNVPIDRDTSVWLTGIGAELSQRLSSVGLVEARAETTLGAFTEKYIQRRTDVKPQTRVNFAIGRQRLIDFFRRRPTAPFHHTGIC
jgi:hypothetical protein